MALGAMIGGESLEALEFSGFILLRGEGELFAVGGSRCSFGHGQLLFLWRYAGTPAYVKILILLIN
jgi:hypothetical protein